MKRKAKTEKSDGLDNRKIIGDLDFKEPQEKVLELEEHGMRRKP